MNPLVTPSFGLLFWQVVTFLVVLLLLSKFAWKPIMAALREREENIDAALSMAEKAKLEMQALKADNERLLNEARAERERILKEATEAANHLVESARAKATEEGQRMIEQARVSIVNEKKAALTEVKNLAATLSIDIAEKLIRRELQDEQAQRALVQSYLQETHLS
ncbi:F0F1 ATP synthase subunit B [Rufibacter glacialis]|uniref:ATP synthase subunit b n=1 Tax=Rufibacter glacialis TaxID=1259555 RepID=A0A5M8Q7L6_9BACT|nr:F0F1 ATP synthase subunit B [Rufibacter glacialis]KAA6431061.1 F0F1 ATP synthase subunit B [Rufibacter glacialis]GGK83702.1 ATP synthase subunit b [Rufibacter glacialis]